MTPTQNAISTANLDSAVAIVAWEGGPCNDDIASAWRNLGIAAIRMSPGSAADCLRAGDVALNRIDVAQTLDGVQPGMGVVQRLQQSGVRVLNRPSAMLATHDKLETARLLGRASLPQPHTVYVAPDADAISLPTPLVLKPRFGSWGRDVVLCRTRAEVSAALEQARHRPWFRRRGAVAQVYLHHTADLRLLIAGAQLAGSIERRPKRGEWRTNYSLGGSRHGVIPPAVAVALAVEAAAVVGADLVGVDLIAVDRRHVILELNGAVDFDRVYSMPGRDVYRDVARNLGLPVSLTFVV